MEPGFALKKTKPSDKLLCSDTFPSSDREIPSAENRASFTGLKMCECRIKHALVNYFLIT